MKADIAHAAVYNYEHAEATAGFMAARRKKINKQLKTSGPTLFISCKLLPCLTMTRVSVSLPDWLVKIIDTERGDVPRSRYIFRLIQRINKHVTEGL